MLSAYGSIKNKKIWSLVRRTADTGDKKGFFIMQPGARQHACVCMSSDFCNLSLHDFSNIISAPSQPCDISLILKSLF